MSVHVLRLYVTVPYASSMSSWQFDTVCVCPSSVCEWLFHVHPQCQADNFTMSVHCPQGVCDCSISMLNVKLTISQCLCMSSACMWLLHVHPQCQADNFTMSVHVLRMYVTVPCASSMSSWQFHNVCACPQPVCDCSMCILNVELIISQCLCIVLSMWVTVSCASSMSSWQFHNVCALSSACEWLFYVHAQCQADNFTMSVHCPQYVSDGPICILNVKLTTLQHLCMPSACMWLFYVHISGWQFYNVLACPQHVCNLCVPTYCQTHHFSIFVHVYSLCVHLFLFYYHTC
jgi:hypothetical protein